MESPRNRPRTRTQTHSFLLGIGFDAEDGHRRITRGDGFHLEGGSHETHQDMQEKVIRLVERLERKGRSIPGTSAEELCDILDETAE